MKRLLSLLCLVLLAATCSNESRDPVIKGYRIHHIGDFGFGLDGVTADVSVDLDVENPSSTRYSVETMQAIVYKNTDTVRLALVDLQQPVSLDPRTDVTLSLPLGVRILRPLALLSGNLDMDLSQYVADIDLTARKGSFKKRIQKKRIPLDRLEKLLGASSQQQNPHENE